MRTSPDYFPERISFTCRECWGDFDDVKVDSIESDDVVVICPACGASHYERVID